jgi:RNA polymerase sigma-70 factor (ECF subfamily)
MTKTDEKELFLQIADGSEPAFRELYYSYGRLLSPFLVRLAGSQDLADEIIQEVFLRVWLYRDKLPGVEHPRAWLFQIASNQAHTWLAKSLKAEMAEVRHQGRPVTADTPAEILTINEIKRVIRKAVEELPAQRKRIYLLHREQGMKAGEIAEILGISISTVKNSLLSAAQNIREKVVQAGYWVPLLLLFWKKV